MAANQYGTPDETQVAKFVASAAGGTAAERQEAIRRLETDAARGYHTFGKAVSLATMQAAADALKAMDTETTAPEPQPASEDRECESRLEAGEHTPATRRSENPEFSGYAHGV